MPLSLWQGHCQSINLLKYSELNEIEASVTAEKRQKFE
jgi:hypothetical protein